MAEAQTAARQETSSPAYGRDEQDFTAGPPAEQSGGVLTVDLGALEANWRALSRRATPAECAAVVKADGYGCGLEQVAYRLARVGGCKTLFVADLAEAARARSVAPDAAIYVLNGLLPGTAAAFADVRARPVIGSLVELARDLERLAWALLRVPKKCLCSVLEI